MDGEESRRSIHRTPRRPRQYRNRSRKARRPPRWSSRHQTTGQQAALRRQIRLHEGERLKVYKCTGGKLTIGVGRNLEDRITVEESNMLLDNDLAAFQVELLRKLPWVSDLDDVRQRVLIDMAFNLGMSGLLTFKNTLAAIKSGDYERGARGMLESKWATQVGKRGTTELHDADWQGSARAVAEAMKGRFIVKRGGHYVLHTDYDEIGLPFDELIAFEPEPQSRHTTKKSTRDDSYHSKMRDLIRNRDARSN